MSSFAGPSPRGSSTAAFLLPSSTVNTLCDLFDRHHREIHREAIRGPSKLIDRVFELRRQVIRERFGTSGALGSLGRARTEIDRFLTGRGDRIAAPPLQEQDFVLVRGSVTPVLNRPRGFSVDLPATATDTVLELVDSPARPRAESVFARSVFPSGYIRFRTVQIHGVPSIMGEDGRTILHLAGIAHELGHCLFEDANGRQDTRHLIESETCAHVVEDLLVRAALARIAGPGSELLAEWRGYQERVDRLNLQYFRLEFQEIAGGPPVPPPSFEPRFHVFRETYVVNPGYQMVYALASLLRSWLAETQQAGPSFLSGLTSPGWLAAAGFSFADEPRGKS